MADIETREKRYKRRKRNEVARVMYENKGAFAIKPHNPKKQQYKRVKLRPQDINTLEEDGEDD